MYYDLMASLPHLTHFAHTDRAPITRLRLQQRLQRLRPEHADQLNRARPLVRFRPPRLLGDSDAVLAAAYAALVASPLDPPLRSYVQFRIGQQTLLEALRRKALNRGLPERPEAWAPATYGLYLRRHWDAPDFALSHLVPWMPQASALLAAGDARSLERLVMDVAWRQLCRLGEQNMFGFQAVFAYVFKWDILQDALADDAVRGQARFTQLVDEVTYVADN